MAGTILTYLKEFGEKSFLEMPLNDVDALILCQFAYLKFDGMVPDVNVNAAPVSIRKLSEHPGRDALFADERYEKVNRELFEGLLSGRRFGTMKLNAYVNLIEKEWETQFSAVTCLLEDGSRFLAFRGTDESIVGWKEDCNMAFLCPVPAQHCARKYCNLVASRWKGDFYLGGHSKGGNLAIYAAMNCATPLQERILRVYSMDGPGFPSGIQKNYAYERMTDRVIKILPRSSLIGMLFGQDDKYRVVESKSFGLFQHNPYSWIVEHGHFIEAADLYEGRKFLDQTINEWIFSLSEAERKEFVNTFFQILEASKAEDLLELNADKKKSILAMADALKGLSPETSKRMGDILKQLFEIAGTNAIREINQKLQGIGENHRNKKTGEDDGKKEQTDGTDS